MRFQTIKVKAIYHKDQLCDEFKNSKYPLPDNLRNGRNVAIILGYLEFFCCFASFAFYIRRRSKVILTLMILNFLFTVIGFYSKIKLSYWGLLTHATYTISVIGALYIYIFIDYALTSDMDNDPAETAEDEAEKGVQSLNQTVILLITSLPMLSLFIMGIYSCFLAIQIENELESR